MNEFDFLGAGMGEDGSKRVARWQWGWAVAAAATAAWGTATMLYHLGQGGYIPASPSAFVLTTLATSMPLVMRGAPRAFTRCCLVIGLALLVWALVGAMIGMFVFLPAAVLLLIASFAGPRNQPGG
ncbi:hypothetical protein [Streptomyces virginiae]|uniref:hypothetical protein n=1 Tax=Streptomyces virginiae TaxID=1961 RepID=UPI0034514E23